MDGRHNIERLLCDVAQTAILPFLRLCFSDYLCYLCITNKYFNYEICKTYSYVSGVGNLDDADTK